MCLILYVYLKPFCTREATHRFRCKKSKIFVAVVMCENNLPYCRSKKAIDFVTFMKAVANYGRPILPAIKYKHFIFADTSNADIE